MARGPIRLGHLEEVMPGPVNPTAPVSLQYRTTDDPTWYRRRHQ
jgi:hypothetical protein